MKELEYPFDANLLLAKKRKIRRELLKNAKDFPEKKIAVLGGSTTDDIRQMMELFLLHHGIRPLFYESEYNRYYQDAVFPNEELEQFQPDVVYFHTTNRNITAYPVLADSKERVEEMLGSELGKYQTMWDAIAEKYQCPIVQNNFELPLYRLMGNKDASDIHGAGNFIARLNLGFYEYAQAHENFYICDINYISADYGLKEWSDPFYWYMYKYALNVSAIPYLAHNVANIIKSIFGRNKKGFVLDLDNTLWGGIIGDDGVDGIEIGPEESGGQVFHEFQAYIKAHKQMGIVLNIDSKNEEENAHAGLNHPDGILRPDDFAVVRANWEPKDRNFLEIANALNLLPESLVFVDDNPAERHIVAGQGVSAPELGEPHQYIQAIDRSGFFEATVLSDDDLKRNQMYQENARRREWESAFSDYHSYLLSLEMRAAIRAFEPVYYMRIAQLTNKSNQFNLTTKRFTPEEIRQLAEDSDKITLYGKLADRFGDNGVVSVVIGDIVDGECRIILWIMSCRVLKRDMEFAMMDALVRECRKRGIKHIRGYYYPTKKNGMVREFYAAQGFEKVAEDDKGNTEWVYPIPDAYSNKTDVIFIEEENNDER